MNKYCSFLLTGLIICITIAPAFSQKKLLTIEDASRRNPTLSPETLKQLQWITGTDKYAWIGKGETLISVEPVSGKESALINLSELNYKLLQFEKDTLNGFPNIYYISDTFFTFIHKSFLYTCNYATGDLSQICSINPNAENIDLAPGNNAIAHTEKNNLMIVTRNLVHQVTADTNPDIINGQSVHRDEFGIYKGTFWSPSGKYLAWYRMDQSMVTDYPLVRTETRIAEPELIKYPMAGMKSHEVTLCIYYPEDQKTCYIDTGHPADQYLTSITWDPDEKFIYIALLNREQNHLKLNKYDVSTGSLVKTLFEEKHDKYVEPLWPLHFFKQSPNRFIWASERDGYNHMYLYDTDGNLIKQLTSGKWVVTGILGPDTKGENLFFTSTLESPLQDNIYKLDLRSGEIKKISVDHGSHSGMVSSSGRYIIDVFSSTDKYSCIKLFDSKGKEIRTLLDARNPLNEYELGEMSLLTVKADDDTELYARLIKPLGFDPAKKYPVFLYVYGGPHSQLVTDSRLGGADLFMYYMAQQGYVVFTLDNRGTDNRGRDFEQAIFRNLGEVEVNDQMAGVKYLKNLPFVDPERIGVNGWSYGGFMTISMMLKNPGVFKVGVAGGPVIDWKYYEVMYGERYMDTPQENTAGYESSSLLNQAQNLTGKLLIIHGTMDPTVVWQNSLVFLKKCIDLGKQLDYFVYPGHPHNVRGKDRIHLNQKIAQYFDENL